MTSIDLWITFGPLLACVVILAVAFEVVRLHTLPN